MRRATDPLTGLPDRVAWTDALRAERLRRARYRRPVVLMSVHVDGLVATRRRHGPGAAEELLVATGRILRRSLRDSDFVARVGPNEFGVILPETVGEAMDAIVERIAQAAEAWRGPEAELRLALSVGWAVPEPFGDLRAARRAAGDRMESARRGA